MTYVEYLDIQMIPGLFAVLCALAILLAFGIRVSLRMRFKRRTCRTSQPARDFGRVLRNSGAPSWKRKIATRALGMMNTSAALEELVTFFGPGMLTEDRGIIEAAIKALGMTNSARAVECLKGYIGRLVLLCQNPTQQHTGKALEKGLIGKTGKSAIKVLGTIGDPSAAPVLNRALTVKALSRQARKALKRTDR